jgi:hypothetical protein
VRHERAQADDDDVASFSCGEAEVDAYFLNRRWVRRGQVSPPTYKFLTSTGETLAYASMALRDFEHPHNKSGSKARYGVIYAFGVCQRFHRIRNPDEPRETYAVSVLRVLAQKAKEKHAVGIALRVRRGNAQAIACYVKTGFVADPAGPEQYGEGEPYLTMRLMFAAER